MKNKIVELVNLWAAYEAEQPDLTLSDFCTRYLSEQVEQPVHESDGMGIPVNGILAGLTGKLGNYSGLYSKKALSQFGLRNIDDWVYLIRLMGMGTPKKSELIYDLVSEFPSGIDVIKRLVSMQLVEEFPDDTDKRSKRLKITPEGLEVLNKSLPYMEKVGEMAFDTLSIAEKNMLMHLLKKLDNFHASCYKEVRNADWETAYQRLTKQEIP